MAIYTSNRAIETLVGRSAEPEPIEATGELGGSKMGFSARLALTTILKRQPNSEYKAVYAQIRRAGIRISKLKDVKQEGQVFTATVTNTEIGTSPFMRYGGMRMVWCWWLSANIKSRSNTKLIMLGSPDNDPTLEAPTTSAPAFGYPSYPNSLSKLIKEELGLSTDEYLRALADSTDTDQHLNPGYRLRVAESVLERGRQSTATVQGHQKTWVNYKAGRTRIIGIADSVRPSAQKPRSVLARPVIVVQA